MDVRETLALYEVVAPGLFVIGSLCDPNEQVAVSVQQTRAVNLIHALTEPASPGVGARVAAGSSVCVIGAGAAGLTAAAYAMTRGLRVTVLEQRQPLWNLRGCRTRWLHPNLFPRWPDEGWELTATDLPVMNWHAGYADRVGDLLLDKYRSYHRSHQGPTDPIGFVTEVTRIVVDPTGATVEWRWREPRTDPPTGRFAAVIVAVGFGAEARLRDAATSVYWVDDALERPDPHRPTTRFLVSGAGDGGLTDLLRLTIANFRHHHLREILQSVAEQPSFIDEIKGIEADGREAWLRGRDDRERALADRDFTRRLDKAAHDYPGGSLFRKFRLDTEVVLTGLSEVAFSPVRGWRVSRVLAALVMAQRGVEYVPSRKDTRIEALTPYGEGAPTEYVCRFPSGPRWFDAIVYRRGTSKIAAPLLSQWGVEPRAIEAAGERWANAWVRWGTTARPLWSPCNADGRYRCREECVAPIDTGRTVIGLLSRLIASVGRPAEGVLRPRPPMRTDRVCEHAAFQLTASDALMQPAGEHGWSLPGTIRRDNVIEVIQWLDVNLDCMVDKTRCTGKPCRQCRGSTVADLRHLLEVHWVLPRPDWLPSLAGDLLLFTSVARNWGSRRMRYVRLESSPLADPAAANRAATWCRDVLREPRTLGVADLLDMPARVAVTTARDRDTLRLLAELDVTHVFDGRNLGLLSGGGGIWRPHVNPVT